jgi:hypothetical protein
MRFLVDGGFADASPNKWMSQGCGRGVLFFHLVLKDPQNYRKNKKLVRLHYNTWPLFNGTIGSWASQLDVAETFVRII